MLISAVPIPKKGISMVLSPDVVSWVVCRWRAAQIHGGQWKKPPQGSQDDARWCLTSRLDLIMHLRIRYWGSCPSPLHRNPYIHGRILHCEYLYACSMSLGFRFTATTRDWRASVTFKEAYRCGSVLYCGYQGVVPFKYGVVDGDKLQAAVTAPSGLLLAMARL